PPTQQLSPTRKDVNNNVLSGRTVTWTSSSPAVAAVDVNGFVTADAPGNTTITATSEGKIGSAAITVTQAPVTTVTVSLSASSINAVQTTQGSATLLDAQGHALTGRTITWSSDNTTEIGRASCRERVNVQE